MHFLCIRADSKMSLVGKLYGALLRKQGVSMILMTAYTDVHATPKSPIKLKTRKIVCITNLSFKYDKTYFNVS